MNSAAFLKCYDGDLNGNILSLNGAKNNSFRRRSIGKICKSHFIPTWLDYVSRAQLRTPTCNPLSPISFTSPWFIYKQTMPAFNKALGAAKTIMDNTRHWLNIELYWFSDVLDTSSNRLWMLPLFQLQVSPKSVFRITSTYTMYKQLWSSHEFGHQDLVTKNPNVALLFHRLIPPTK